MSKEVGLGEMIAIDYEKDYYYEINAKLIEEFMESDYYKMCCKRDCLFKNSKAFAKQIIDVMYTDPDIDEKVTVKWMRLLNDEIENYKNIKKESDEIVILNLDKLFSQLEKEDKKNKRNIKQFSNDIEKMSNKKNYNDLGKLKNKQQLISRDIKCLDEKIKIIIDDIEKILKDQPSEILINRFNRWMEIIFYDLNLDGQVGLGLLFELYGDKKDAKGNYIFLEKYKTIRGSLYGQVLWPSIGYSINSARKSKFDDRIDYTLYDIKKFYEAIKDVEGDKNKNKCIKAFSKECRLVTAYQNEYTLSWLLSFDNFEDFIDTMKLDVFVVNVTQENEGKESYKVIDLENSTIKDGTNKLGTELVIVDDYSQCKITKKYINNLINLIQGYPLEGKNKEVLIFTQKDKQKFLKENKSENDNN